MTGASSGASSGAATTLADHLTDAASTWLEGARADVQQNPALITRYFPVVSRRCGRAPLEAGDPQGLRHGTVDDAARGVLLGALRVSGQARVDLLDDLYRHGDAGEKRGVLRGLHRLDTPGADPANPSADPGTDPGIGPALLALIDDALRTNDLRLIAAAVQPYGAHYLGADAYRHAVVKCVFTGVPLHVVGNLAERQGPELARMLVDLAHERAAAGRGIPPDIHAVVAAFPACLDRPDLPAALLAALLPSPVA
ncbi:EboA domain-containing protein [Cryobacterium sp. PH31-L1]|uniref:EboA domain-containing protein n=1 Tax=Cryobacterium sp. PH31-L1 TaxID=3046199 RepID=UPI0024BB1B9B|nr:EboA domain-containing protein [Cryobacterium sp. PH31-L1]MDJ0376866.1 EboA domain-containing protein [Cryobacterium sp. PH31-L1]